MKKGKLFSYWNFLNLFPVDFNSKLSQNIQYTLTALSFLRTPVQFDGITRFSPTLLSSVVAAAQTFLHPPPSVRPSVLLYRSSATAWLVRETDEAGCGGCATVLVNGATRAVQYSILAK